MAEITYGELARLQDATGDMERRVTALETSLADVLAQVKTLALSLGVELATETSARRAS